MVRFENFLPCTKIAWLLLYSISLSMCCQIIFFCLEAFQALNRVFFAFDIDKNIPAERIPASSIAKLCPGSCKSSDKMEFFLHCAKINFQFRHKIDLRICSSISEISLKAQWVMYLTLKSAIEEAK